MIDFKDCLERTGEVGFVEQTFHSIVYVKGLPSIRPNELVIFENGDLGEAISLNEEYVEVLMFSKTNLRVETQAARTDKILEIPVGDSFLGKIINPLGMTLSGSGKKGEIKEKRKIDIVPAGMQERENLREPFTTGVTVVDLVVPLGKGQRELVIGDRKTGKTQFLMQTVYAHASKGGVCVYAGISKRYSDIVEIWKYLSDRQVTGNVIMVATSSADPAGMVFINPYSAMTHAEYFRDQGRDVLVILDDLTIHAKYYREISLLAKRFPGRSSYPGDIFYLHSRLVERAGKFKKGSITCLPVAETVLGDISGYIQTNLMSMTDGHIFFDHDLYNQGRRPAVNHFLSVTRVGLQTRSPFLKDLNRELGKFLVYHERMRQFIRFGGEVSEKIKNTLDLGDKVIQFFNQPYTKITIQNVNVIILCGLWAGFWTQKDKAVMLEEMEKIARRYEVDKKYQAEVDNLVNTHQRFFDLVERIKHEASGVIRGA